MSDQEVVLTQTQEGYPTVVQNKWGKTRTVQVDRVWDVTLAGEVIGQIRYGLITRERRGKGMRYVYARWQSPGWECREAGTHGYFGWFERTSRKECINILVLNAGRSNKI